MRTAAGVAFSCLLLLIGIEAALQLAALLAPDRAGAWRPGAEVKILCVGDSHTFGSGVPGSESYPAHLQALLDERRPGRYSVINLGVPGMGTPQVRERLPVQLARYEPDLVILWAGINNSWNAARSDAPSASERIEALALRSRLYRLVRVFVHDLGLERVPTGTRSDGLSQEAENREKRGLRGELTRVWHLRHGGVEEVITNRFTGERDFEVQVEQTALDIGAMARALEAAGVAFALVRYPLEVEPFTLANQGILAGAQEFGIPVADSERALERVPPEQQDWAWALHPTGPIYREIARELVPIVEDLMP